MTEYTDAELAEFLAQRARDVHFYADNGLPGYKVMADKYEAAAARLRARSEDTERLDTEATCPHCNGRGVVNTAFRCVVDGEDDADDYCVLDHGRPQDCVYAPDVLKAGGKHMCGEWRRVAIDSARKRGE